MNTSLLVHELDKLPTVEFARCTDGELIVDGPRTALDTVRSFIQYQLIELHPQTVSETPTSWHFITFNCSTALAHALHRVLTSELSSVAIDSVVFHENHTYMNNEYLTHRLGMIPLRPLVSCPETCTGCTHCVQTHVICEQGPQRVMFQGCFLLELHAGHRLHLTATTRRGKGKEHVKFRNWKAFPLPLADIPTPALPVHCPRNVFDMEDIPQRPLNCTFCGQCAARERPDAYQWKIESAVVAPRDLWTRALEILATT